jgi:hypothetical protein
LCPIHLFSSLQKRNGLKENKKNALKNHAAPEHLLQHLTTIYRSVSIVYKKSSFGKANEKK